MKNALLLAFFASLFFMLGIARASIFHGGGIITQATSTLLTTDGGLTLTSDSGTELTPQ